MNPHYQSDAVRREQIAEGERMARSDDPDNRIMARRVNPHAPRGGKKDPTAPKGHEAFLKALEGSQTPIQVEKASTGELVNGCVKHSDKYTITLRCVSDDGSVLNRVLFKHDISEFRALGPKPDEAVQ